ncbi:MAG: HNH endonuclease [Blastocatellia bacterium]|nr:HNH endonuclease [Blastocatellia bacterium]
MAIKASVRERVRERADFACEFCGISETDAGGQLTIDHYRPKNKGGDNDHTNLIYCCPRCNQYKLDYWPTRPDDLQLWNPRLDPPTHHFLLLDDGTLHPLTEIGAFTLRRMRLNRPPLVAHRLRRIRAAEETRLLTHYCDLVRLIEQLLIQQTALMEEQQKLLHEQRELLEQILHNREKSGE